MDNKWILKIKRCSDGTIEKYKDRRMMQRQGSDFVETYSTCKYVHGTDPCGACKP